jgi:hypothetical protein
MKKLLSIIMFLLLMPCLLAVDFTPSGNVNGRNIYDLYNFKNIYNITNISATNIRVNGSLVCTASNGLCASTAQDNGWRNTSTTIYTTKNYVNIGGNTTPTGYQGLDNAFVLDGADVTKGIVWLKPSGSPKVDIDTFAGEDLTKLYIGYWYDNQATALVLDESNRVGINKDGNYMDVGITGVSFRGTGLNDLSVTGSSYDKRYATEYIVEMNTTNSYRYKTSILGNPFSEWSNVILVTTPTTLDGIVLNWGSATGYTPGDSYFFIGQTQKPPSTLSISPIGYRYVLSTKDAGNTFVDETMTAGSANTVDTNTVIDNGVIDNDTYLYLASGVRQDNIYVELSQGGDNITLEVQYPTSQNTWVTLNESNLYQDETYNLSQTGSIFYSVDTMPDWNSSITVDGLSGLYWLRLHSARISNVTPLINGINPNADNRLCILAHPQDTICTVYVKPSGELKATAALIGEDPRQETYAGEILNEALIVHNDDVQEGQIILGNIDAYYSGLRVKNVNHGTDSSSNFYIENDRPYTDNHFLEIGCNGQNYAPGTGLYNQPDDCYINNEASNLIITTGNDNKKIVLSVGHDAIGTSKLEINNVGTFVDDSQVCTIGNGLCATDISGKSGTGLINCSTGYFPQNITLTSGDPSWVCVKESDGNLSFNQTLTDNLYYNKTYVDTLGNATALNTTSNIQSLGFYSVNDTYNKSEIDAKIAANYVIYWFTNETNVNGTKNMSLVQPNGTTKTNTYPITNTKISIGRFITKKETTNVTFLSGMRTVYLTARLQAAAPTAQIQTVVYRCYNYSESTDSCTGGLGVFTNSSETLVTGDADSSYRMSYTIQTAYTLPTTDRFILNITAVKVDGANTNMHVSVDGESYSRIEVPRVPEGTTSGSGTVTSISSGTYTTGGTITSTGTIDVNLTAVTNNIGNASKLIGTCGSGQGVQNITASGPQCFTPAGSTYSNGTGLTLTGTQFNLSTSYTDARYLQSVPYQSSAAGWINTTTNTTTALKTVINNNLSVAGIVNIVKVETNPTNTTRPVLTTIELAVNPATAPVSLVDYHGLDVNQYGSSANINSNTGFYAVEGRSSYEGTGVMLKSVGVYGLAKNSAAGNTTEAMGMQAWVQNTGSGTMVSGTGLYIQPALNSGGGNITTNYGLRIGDQTAGDTDYAIYTGAGNVRFGGPISATTGVTSSGNIVASSSIIWGKNFQGGSTSLAEPSNFEFYTAPGYARQNKYYSNGLLRLAYGTAGETESGSNIGTDFSLYTYNDSGTFVDIPFKVLRRSGGEITLGGTTNRTVSLSGNLTVAKGMVISGNITMNGSTVCTATNGLCSGSLPASASFNNLNVSGDTKLGNLLIEPSLEPDGTIIYDNRTDASTAVAIMFDSTTFGGAFNITRTYLPYYSGDSGITRQLSLGGSSSGLGASPLVITPNAGDNDGVNLTEWKNSSGNTTSWISPTGIIYNNGSVVCTATNGLCGGGPSGNPFDQTLNTTSNVTFKNVNITSGNITLNNFTFVTNATTVQIYNGAIRVAIVDSAGNLRIKGEIITNDATV